VQLVSAVQSVESNKSVLEGGWVLAFFGGGVIGLIGGRLARPLKRARRECALGGLGLFCYNSAPVVREPDACIWNCAFFEARRPWIMDDQ